MTNVKSMLGIGNNAPSYLRTDVSNKGRNERTTKWSPYTYKE